MPKAIFRALQILFFGLSVPCYLPAQELKFNHLGSDQGLSQAVVNAIFQDNRGFMWFATQEGLNKYDGYSFSVYKHDPNDSNSISGSFINAVYQDKNGNIWVGSNGSGLDMYSEVTGRYRHFSHDTKNNNSISNNTIRAIEEDADGIIWVGTDNGLNSLDPKTGKFRQYLHSETDPNSLTANQVYDIHIGKDGRIWLATYEGWLNVFDKKNGKFTSYGMNIDAIRENYAPVLKTQNENDLAVKTSRIRCIYENRDGNFWLGTDGGGILVFDPRTGRFLRTYYSDPANYRSLSGGRVHAICNDELGRIWVGTFGKGLNILNAVTGDFDRYEADDRNPYGLNHNDVKCILPDRQGNVWVGTNGGGVNVFFKSMGKFAHIKKSERPGVGENSLKSDVVMSVIEDREGLLWVGTYSGGLTTIDRRTNRYTHYPELSTSTQNVVLSLLETKDGRIWVGTYGDGINVYNKATHEKKHYSVPKYMTDGTVMCMAEDKEGFVWFGTYDGGLYKINPRTEEVVNYTRKDGLPCDGMFSICFDRNGNLWIGGIGGGLIFMDRQSGKFKTYKHDKNNRNSISNDMVNVVYEDAKGRIWMGTTDGLNMLDPASGKISTWYERDGLLSDYVYGIVSDSKGYIWLSTNKGITRFDPAAENTDGAAFRNFGVNDGVQRGEFDQGAYFKSRRGEIFFGGMYGLNTFFPDKIMDNSNVPPVLITSYKRFGKEVSLDTSILYKKRIVLDWKDNYISFEFTALDFAMPSKNKYQFKLEGFDDDWSPPTHNRFASYTNLPGGDYVFRVRGANSEGVWNEEGASLYIRINPPFWKTNWFYTLCVLVTIAGIFGFIRYRTGAIQKENKLLEAKVAERTYELAQKNADITASIQYARRIQFAMLPPLELVYAHLPHTFVLYRPKDIVSGDFYWFGEKNGRKIIAAVDCTGHGVPGALMSMIGHNLLNQIILEKGITEPAAILSALHDGVQTALKQGQYHLQDGTDSADGMDVCLCSIDLSRREVQYAGALRPLVVVRKGILNKIDADRHSIGGKGEEGERRFTNHSFLLDPGDAMYLFSDGYADQFGGEKGKKFMVKRMLEMILSIQHLDMRQQGEFLEETLSEWMGAYEQVDDVLVIGVKMADDLDEGVELRKID